MASSKQLGPIDLYYILMFEARQRIEAINFILAGRTGLPEKFARELCYLQLRMLCENIALGCMVAHGDVLQSNLRPIEKEWSAEKIIEKLEKLNPHFFPQQAVLSTAADASLSITANTNANALKKEELSILYAKCGGHLHRGTLKAIVRANHFEPAKLNAPEVVHWTQKIEDLLGSHIIPLYAKSEERSVKAAILVCVLRDYARGFDTTVKRVEFQRPQEHEP